MSHMKLKKMSKRKKFKYIFLLLLVYLVFGYTIYYSFRNSSRVTNEEFIKFILNNGNIYDLEDKGIYKLLNKSLGFLLKIDITKPYTLFNENIIGYEVVKDDEDNTNLEELKAISSYINDPNKVDIDKPIIYIYNSHQLENYNNSNLSIYGITPNVLMASYLLKEKLNNLGISTIVEDTNITEFLDINNWDYSASYKASRIFLLDKKNTYSSIKYFIDIHRDSVGKELTTVSINNKNYARILFVVGLEHSNYEKNLMLANNLNDLFNKYYPGISRGIYKKEGPNVNGIYNQDISENVMLIELGGVDNNIEEVMNSVNAISDIIYKYVGDYDKK